MAITIPGANVPDTGLIVKGPCDFYDGAYLANGQDSTFQFLGGRTTKGTFNFQRKWHMVSIEDFLSACDAAPSGEEFKISVSFIELNLERIRAFTGAYGLTLTGGTTSNPIGTLALGEDRTTTFRQLLVRAPAPSKAGASARMYIQLWKTFVSQVGPMEFAKDGHASLAVTFSALVDTTTFGTANGAVGRIVVS